ncbi:MAG: hypothetical protein PVI93_16140, partial [Desulfobacterales bacterium]
MNPTRLKSLVFIIGLIAATGAALAYSTGAGKTWLSAIRNSADQSLKTDSSPVSLSGHLVQSKVLQG